MLRSRLPSLLCFFAVLLSPLSTVHGQDVTVSSAERDEARSGRIGQQLITLISFTALPGVSGARFNVTRGGNDPDYDLWKVNIGTRRVRSLENQDFDLYVEGGIGYLETDENSFGSEVIGDSAVRVKTDRKVYSGHFGIGPSFPFAEHFRLTPIARVAISRFDNKTGLGELGDSVNSPEDILRLDWNLTAATLAGALQFSFDRPFGDRKIEAKATYTHAYTNVFDAPSSRLEYTGHNDILTLLGRHTAPTPWQVSGRPLHWSLFGTGTVLAGDGKDALGFSSFVEIGAGLDLDLRGDNLPILKALRGRASVIYGNNVTGFQLGVSFGF